MASRSLFRRMLRWTTYVVVAVLALAVSALGFAHTDWGRRRIVGIIERQASRFVDGELRIGRLEGSIFGNVTLREVRITRGGANVGYVDRLSARYHVASLLGPVLTIDALTVEGIQAALVEGREGWHIDGITVPPGDDTRDEPGGGFKIGTLVLERSALSIRPQGVEPYELQEVSAEASLDAGEAVTVDVRRLSGVERRGGLRVKKFKSRVVIDDRGLFAYELDTETDRSHLAGNVGWLIDQRVEADVESRGLLLDDVAPYVPAADEFDLQPSFDLILNGPLEAVHVKGAVRDTAAGEADLDAVMRIGADFRAKGFARVRALNVAPVMNNEDMKTALNGEVTFDIAAVEREDIPVEGSFDATLADSSYDLYRISRFKTKGRIDAGVVTASADAVAYGASGVGTYSWRHTSQTFTFQGRVANADPAKLPAHIEVPRWSGNFSGHVSLTATAPAWHVKTTLDESTIEGATIGEGTTADVAMDASEVLTYRVNGHVRDLETARILGKLPEPPKAAMDMPARLSAKLDMTGSGPMSDWLAHDATLDASEIEAQVKDAKVTGGTLTGSVTGGHLKASANAAISGRWDDVANLPESKLAPNGKVVLSVDIADINAPMTAESMSGTISATLDGTSAYGVEVRSGTIEATASAGTLTVTRLEANGPLGRIDAKGSVALGDTGTSDLTYTVEITDGKTAAKLLETEASGALFTEGRLTGLRREPTVTGTLQASTLGFGSVSALGAGGNYVVTIPDFDPAQLLGRASVEATFVQASGQEFPRVRLDGSFTKRTSDLEVVAEHKRGVMTVGGEVTLEDDGSADVIARKLNLLLGEDRWELVPGTTPRLRYTAERIEVERTELARGDERVIVEGRLPFEGTGTGDELRVTAERVAIAPFATVWMGSERVTGTIAANAVVRGSTADPRVAATFRVTDGTADKVPFRSLEGEVDLTAGVATIDAKLDAGERGTASVTGAVPLDPAARGLDVALLVALTDIAVAAPAVPYVTEAGGQAQIDLKVTGSVDTPQVQGAGTLTDVRFRVPETGVAYRRINADFAVENSVLNVKKFAGEDSDGNPLEVTGSLDVLRAGGPEGAVNVRVRSNEFRLLDNQFGDVAVNLDLEIAGTMAAPRVRGKVRIERGRIEIDQLLDEYAKRRGATQAGATSPTAPVTVRRTETAPATPASAEQPEATAPPPVFRQASMDLDLELPDNVVVRGRGIQTEEGSFGLGDVNLTLGGTLKVTKQPGGEASLVGEVAAVRGTYEFQGRRFAIQRGSVVRFRGDDYSNPSLEIAAEREISGVTVEIRVTGTVAEPSLSLSSQPPLDQSDILSLVVFNQPINELGNAQRANLAARAGSLAAGAVAGPLAGAVARALDLDVFDIQTGEVGTAGPVVTVGRQVSDRLFVGFRHEFGGEGANRLTFEYRLNEFLRIVTSLSPGAQSVSPATRTEAAGVDLIFTIRR